MSLRRIRNAKGYSTVFFALMILIFLGVFSLCAHTLLQIMASNEQLRQASTASQNLLSYYDDALESDYGLLAYSQKSVQSERIFQDYQGDGWCVTPLQTLSQLSSFQEQTIALGKIHLAETGLEALTTQLDAPMPTSPDQALPMKPNNPFSTSGSEERKETALSEGEKRRARNLKRRLGQDVTKDWQTQNGGSISEQVYTSRFNFDRGSAMSLTLTQKTFLVAYLNAYFNNYVQWQKSPEGIKNSNSRCFQGGEIEFVLEGDREASANQMRINAKIFLIREGVNLTHIVQSREKMATTSGLATLICALFPLGEPLVQAGLVTLWAGMESAFEVRLLLEGNSIPAIKTVGGEWYTDLESGLTTAPKASKKGDVNQVTYFSFLNLFLMAQADRVTAERAMTLIDLNLKQSGHPIGDWTDMVTRHKLSMKQKNGKEISIEDGYLESKQREGQSKR